MAAVWCLVFGYDSSLSMSENLQLSVLEGPTPLPSTSTPIIISSLCMESKQAVERKEIMNIPGRQWECLSPFHIALCFKTTS